MRRIAKIMRIAVVAGVALASPLTAYPVILQDPAAPAPVAVAAAGPEAVTATITSVKGYVQVRADDAAAAWKPAVVGQKLEQGAAIQTGLRSVVQFLVGTDETITLDRLGEVTLLQAIKDKGKAKTDLGLKYGRARYDINATDLQHASTIRSPGSTLAIKGTDVTYEDQAPWVPTAISRNGRAEFRNYRRQFVAFGGKSRATVAADKTTPAQNALSKSKDDPRGAFAGRTAAEDNQNVTVQSIGGADAEVQRAVRDVLRGFALGPNASAIGVVNGLGPLEFTLEWTSLGAAGQSGPSNLDLIVTDPKGRILSPTSPTAGSGTDLGQHFGDDNGANGVGGERVAWGEFFPKGKYTVQAVHQSGADAQLTVTAFQGEGEQLVQTVLTGDPETNPTVLKAGETFTTTITPSNTQRAAKPQAAEARRAERQQQRQAVQAQKPARAAKR